MRLTRWKKNRDRSMTWRSAVIFVAFHCSSNIDSIMDGCLGQGLGQYALLGLVGMEEVAIRNSSVPAPYQNKVISQTKQGVVFWNVFVLNESVQL